MSFGRRRKILATNSTHTPGLRIPVGTHSAYIHVNQTHIEVKDYLRWVTEERILPSVLIYFSFKIFRELHMRTKDIRLNARTPMHIQTALYILHESKQTD